MMPIRIGTLTILAVGNIVSAFTEAILFFERSYTNTPASPLKSLRRWMILFCKDLSVFCALTVIEERRKMKKNIFFIPDFF
jgi:hypothetical protein